METICIIHLAGEEETERRPAPHLGRCTSRAWYAHVPARMSSAPQGELLSHGPGLFGQTKWKLPAEPTHTSSTLLTNTRGWFVHWLLVTHRVHPCSSASKVSGGGKNQQSGRLARTEKPSPHAPCGYAPRVTCSKDHLSAKMPQRGGAGCRE